MLTRGRAHRWAVGAILGISVPEMALNSLVSKVKGSPFTCQPMSVLNAMTESTREVYSDESTSRIARIFEATTDVVAMADRTGRLLYLNAAGRQLRNLQQDAELSEISIRDLHPAWAFEILAEEGLPSAKADGSWSGETALVSATGRECPVLELVLAHLNEDQEVDFISLICRDISERKLKELEQIEWANRYNAAIRASGQVVFDWDTLSGEIAYGGEIRTLLGFSEEEMSGGIGRLRQLVHPEDLASFDERIEIATMLRDPFEHTFRVLRKGGGEVFVHGFGKQAVGRDDARAAFGQFLAVIENVDGGIQIASGIAVVDDTHGRIWRTACIRIREVGGEINAVVANVLCYHVR